MKRERDKKFMREVFRLAEKGRGTTSPNPMVGAVVVKGNRIVGRGYHKRAGSPHAEVIALKEAGEKARGAILYINLEPCVHYGRTPPCAPRIIEAGVKRVVIAMLDPNPKVNGSGVAMLREAGIDVEVGIEEEKARELNEFYIKHSHLYRRFSMDFWREGKSLCAFSEESGRWDYHRHRNCTL